MCGRFYVDEKTEEDIERLVNEVDQRIRGLNYGDVNPTDSAAVISDSLKSQGKGLRASSMRFGFSGKDRLLINARSETALQKPTFSESLMLRRCVIPAAKFYEWDKDRQKAEFFYPESPSIYLAGFYRNIDGEDRFIILTREANETMAPVHDRMPLILSEQEILPWITDFGEARKLLNKSGVLLTCKKAYEQQRLFL